MIKAILFDCYGVLYVDGACNKKLVQYIEQHLKPLFSCGIVSNALRGEIDRLLSGEVQSVFDVQVLSGEIGFSKPDKEIFARAAHKLGVTFGEIIFIDDRRDFTIAAQALGMQTICYESFDQFRAEIGLHLDR